MSSLSARLSTLVANLRGWPWVVRFLLRVVLTLAATVGPLLVVANWLAIGSITEAWPWFLWGEDYLGLGPSAVRARLAAALRSARVCVRRR